MSRSATFTVLLLIPSALLALFGEADGKDRRKAAQTPREEALVQLGRRLFFDPAVSRSGARSCASCHDPEHGFSDPLRVSEDDFGRTRRHSQTLIDSHLNPSAHWDGEFETIEELVLARIGALKGRKGKLGHGVTLLDAVSEDLREEDTEVEILDPRDVPDGGEDDIIDDGDDVENDDDDNPYDGPRARGAASADGAPRKGASSATSPKPRGTSTPTTPSSPSAPAPSPEAGGGADPDYEPKGAAPEAEAPKGEAGPAAAGKPEPAADPKPAEPKPAKPEPLSLEERKRRAEELRAALRKLPLAADVLIASGRYDEAFAAAFGNRKVNAQRIARAIQAYCDSLHSTEAPVDRFLAGDETALSASARRGLDLFRGRAGCVKCHTMTGPRPTFTDFDFHNTGVVFNRLSKKQRAALVSLDETFLRKRDDLETPPEADEGRARVSTRRDDLRAFKTPTLRDASRRGPYMHDGRFKTLTDVVRYYAKGGSPDPVRSDRVHAFDASAEDVDDLVAFLEALTGDDRPGLPAAAWRERAPKTRLQFVDADGRPLADLEVGLRAVGDIAYDGATIHKLPRSLRTDAKGWIEFTQRRMTHTRIVLPEGLEPEGGAFVPDSCVKARVVVPVRGRTEILVRMHAPTTPPATIAAEHLGTFVLPGHAAPRTRFQRGKSLDLGRTRLVTYRGWLRTDVPQRVQLRVPGLHGAAAEVELSADEPARIDLTK